MMGGPSCGTALQSGSRVRIFESVSEIVPPAKADRPVNMSNKLQPNAQTSARLSIGLPRACSELMNAAYREQYFRGGAGRQCGGVRDRLGRRVGVKRLRQAEIEHLDRPTRGDFDVGRLQVDG